VIVPLDVLPPGTPFTLHVTLVFVVLATVALKFCVFPSNTDPLAGVTVTLIEGGGGGGPETGPPPQPTVEKHAGKS
jgi:hypothetical protein